MGSFSSFSIMRYHYKLPWIYTNAYGITYECNHPLYDCCTLYLMEDKGLAVIQQRFDPETKHTWWTKIDPWLTDALYLRPLFKPYFDERSGKCINGLYPTVTIRQIMWALKMKPLEKKPWETVFDHYISQNLQLV